MVGRGGRSRACFVCRQRRLKCDETKPQCQRCREAGFVCTGYPDNLPFINAGPESFRRADDSSSSSEQLTHASRPQPSLIVLDEDTFRAYVRQEVQTGNVYIDNRWPGFSALDMPDCLSRQCITAFAAALYGRRKNSERARKEGVRLYVESLTKLNLQLAEVPEGSAAGQTALSIGILTTCECLVASSNNGWVQHMVGLATFYRHCPFEMFEEPTVLRHYEGVRFSMIAAAIAARRPMGLMSEEWQTLPWDLAGSTKSQRHYLLDHTSHLPDLYIEYANYFQTTDIEGKSALGKSLEPKLKHLLHTLREWELYWNVQEKTQPKEDVLPERQKREYGFATKLVFDDLDNSAITYLLFNATLIIVLELWRAFRRTRSALSADTGDFAEFDKRYQPNPSELVDDDYRDTSDESQAAEPSMSSIISQSREAALHICRALPPYQTQSGGWRYPFHLTTAIRMALVVLRQDEASPQAAWLESVVQQIGETQQGWEVGKYMMDGLGYY